jgi:futalosine hydrolase
MHILLCTATPFEMGPVTEWIEKEKKEGIELLITGVGLTASAYSITKAICTRKPDLILQAGIGGCFDESMELGSVVAIRNETIGDLGVEEGGRFRSLFDLNLLTADTKPWTNGKLRNDGSLIEKAGLPVVDGMTVNEIGTNAKRIAYWKQEGVTVESMEGAALHYVALQEGVPFLQIRSLSNFAGERDKSKWLMAASIARLNSELQRIILTILNQ